MIWTAILTNVALPSIGSSGKFIIPGILRWGNFRRYAFVTSPHKHGISEKAGHSRHSLDLDWIWWQSRAAIWRQSDSDPAALPRTVWVNGPHEHFYHWPPTLFRLGDQLECRPKQARGRSGFSQYRLDGRRYPGGGLWLGCFIIAWPLTQLYNYPELLWLIPIVGITTIFSGFESTAIAQLERHLEVKTQVLFELTTQAVGLITMIGWAALAPSIWALVFGGLTSAFVKMVWSHILFPGSSNQWAWDKEALKELLTLGRWIFISTALTFLAEQADRLMLGDIFSLRLLGVYGIALTLSNMPYQVVMAVSNKVIFPAISKSIDQPRDILFPKILNNRRPLLLASMLLVLLLVSFGDRLITTLYDARYIDAAWMLPILALGIWPRMLSQTNEPYLFALGKFQYSTYGNFLRLLCTVLGIGVGFQYFGNAGAVIGVALNDLFYYLAVNYGLLLEGLNGIAQDLMATALLLGLITTIVIIRLYFGLGLPIDSLLYQSA